MNIDLTVLYKVITGIVALSGFILSLIQTIMRHKDQKRDLVFCIIKITKTNQAKNTMLIRYRVDNRSSAPINITRIKLLIGDEEYLAHYVPIFAEGYVCDNEMKYFKLTDTMPVNLAAYDSHGGYLAFQLPEEKQQNLERTASLLISTSRGEPAKISLKLNEDNRIRGTRQRCKWNGHHN